MQQPSAANAVVPSKESEVRDALYFLSIILRTLIITKFVGAVHARYNGTTLQAPSPFPSGQLTMGASQSSARAINSDQFQQQMDVQKGTHSSSEVKTDSSHPLIFDTERDKLNESVFNEHLYDPMPVMGKHAESFEEKLYRKVTTEPLVPIGCCVTTYFLASGIRSFMNRDAARSQLMMRGRVAAQGATILAFCFYAGFSNLSLGLQSSKGKSESGDKP